MYWTLDNVCFDFHVGFVCVCVCVSVWKKNALTSDPKAETAFSFVRCFLFDLLRRLADENSVRERGMETSVLEFILFLIFKPGTPHGSTIFDR